MPHETKAFACLASMSSGSKVAMAIKTSAQLESPTTPVPHRRGVDPTDNVQNYSISFFKEKPKTCLHCILLPLAL